MSDEMAQQLAVIQQQASLLAMQLEAAISQRNIAFNQCLALSVQLKSALAEIEAMRAASCRTE